jgi:phage FluMu gp28-like protein
MSKEKDPNYVVKVEKAIAKKYGEETIQNPKANWTDEKEKEYLADLKTLYSNHEEAEDLNKQEVNGVLIPKKLLNNDSNRTCPVCNKYSFKSNDDVYMTKFQCCEKCYIQWVEDREERWLNGWRPNK